MPPTLPFPHQLQCHRCGRNIGVTTVLFSFLLDEQRAKAGKYQVGPMSMHGPQEPYSHS